MPLQSKEAELSDSAAVNSCKKQCSQVSYALPQEEDYREDAGLTDHRTVEAEQGPLEAVQFSVSKYTCNL